MGCCGGGTGRAGIPSAKPSQKAQLEAIARDGERVPVQYIGGRQGSFQLTGPSRMTYNITGADALVTDNNGKPGVLRQDLGFIMNFKGQFKQLTPPKPKPTATAKVIKQPRSVQVDPEMAVDPHADELKFEASVQDPGELTVKAIMALDLTPDVAYVMLSMEQSGKKRKMVIQHLNRIASG